MIALTRDISIIEKIDAVEKQISLQLPQLDLKKLPKMFGRVSHYCRGNIKKLTQEEHLLYDFIIRNKLNHRSLYQWFLLKDAPYDLKKKLANKKIWLRHALREMAEIRRLRENPDDKIILKDIRRCIRRIVQ